MKISMKTLQRFFPLHSKDLLESAHVFMTKYFLIVYYYFGLQSVSLLHNKQGNEIGNIWN